MKTLSLLAPWGWLIPHGLKKIETRSWRTEYRGRIAIHVSARFSKEQRKLCVLEPFLSALCAYKSPPDLWRGCVIGTAELFDCVPTFVDGIPNVRQPARISNEFAFGDYSAERWMWFLRDARQFKEPVPAKGMLGLWEWNGSEP